MTVYVDEIMRHPSGSWSHLMTDGDIEELHRMALAIGLKRSYFQGKNPRTPHYDVRPTKRALAIKLGAIPCDGETLIKKCVWKGDNPPQRLTKEKV